MSIPLNVVYNHREFLSFFFNDPAPTEIYPLPHHDPLPISMAWPPTGLRLSPERLYPSSKSVSARPTPVRSPGRARPPVTRGLARPGDRTGVGRAETRSEEHTSELQSQSNLVCRLLLEKKNQ